MADLNFGCATFCALPSFGAVTTFSSHSALPSHKVSVKCSDVDMCSAIYFLFDHKTKYCKIIISTHCSCHCLVTTSPEYYVTSSCQNESRTHARSTMAKESSEGEFLKKNVLITTGKGLKIYPRQNAVKEKVIHLDQLEFLPIFPNSEL